MGIPAIRRGKAARLASRPSGPEHPEKEFNALSLDTFFKAKVPQMNYLPIDLLTKDNIDFYYPTEIVSK